MVEGGILFKPHPLKLIMPIELAPLLTRFVAHMNDEDSTAFSACFTEDAVVEDEGQPHRGRAAIQAWIANAFTNYAPKLEVANVSNTDAGSVISGIVSGTFPGSPITLHYHVTHDEAQISHLRCTV
ncbi:MAG: hypothetical protein RL015_3544 [Verrucomicrobiota bacterium]|jgi:hypothetical protein